MTTTTMTNREVWIGICIMWAAMFVIFGVFFFMLKRRKKMDVPKELEKAKAWLSILEDSQASRAKHSQLFEKYELRPDGSEAGNSISKLEREVYGGELDALHKRLEHVERAIEEQKQ